MGPSAHWSERPLVLRVQLTTQDGDRLAAQVDAGQGHAHPHHATTRRRLVGQ